MPNPRHWRPLAALHEQMRSPQSDHIAARPRVFSQSLLSPVSNHSAIRRMAEAQGFVQFGTRWADLLQRFVCEAMASIHQHRKPRRHAHHPPDHFAMLRDMRAPWLWTNTSVILLGLWLVSS